MKNRTKLAGTTVGLAFAAMAAGCSSTGSEDSATASVSPDEPVTITVLSGTITEKPDGDVEQAFADAYMAEHPNVTIEYIGVPSNELQTKLAAMASSDTLPDIFFNDPSFAAKSVDLGASADLNGILNADFLGGFEQRGLELASVGDQLVFVPWYSIPTGLIYRTDWFEEADLTPPTTWDEFSSIAQDLTGDTDGDGNVDRWGVALLGSADLSGAGRFIPILRSFGAEELYEGPNGWETGYDTPEGVAAFQLYGDLVNKYQVTPVGTLSTSYPEAVNFMSTGTTAMMVSGSNAIGAILAQNPELEGKLGAVPIPHASGQEPAANLGMGGYSISSTSEYPEVAADYLSFIVNKENQVAWSDATGRLPLRTDALEAISAAGGDLAGFVEAIQYGYAPPQAPFYSTILLAGTDAYQQVILGQTSAEEAARGAAQATRSEIENAG